MINTTSKSRFPKIYHYSEYKRMEDVFVETELEDEYIRLTIKESDKVIWDNKSIAATLIEAPGKIFELKVEKASPYKVVHEIVSLGLTKSKTDRKLMELVNPPYNPSQTRYLNMTPDYIEQINGEIMIGELGTKNTRSEQSLIDTYRIKNSDLQEKVRGSGLKHETFCIIVSPTMIYSNLEFSDDQTDILCSLFRLGERVFLNICDRYGIAASETDDSIPKFRQRISTISQSIHLPEDDNPLIISDSMIDHWYSEISQTHLSEVSSGILRECIIESKKYTSEPYTKERFFEDFDKLKAQTEREGCKTKTTKAFKVPFFTGRVSGPVKAFSPISNDNDNPYISLVNMIMPHVQEKSQEVVEIFENDDIWSQTNTRSFGFVDASLTDRQREEFSKLGLFAKRKKDKEVREESKKQVSLDSDTSRISTFLSNGLHEEDSPDDTLEACFETYNKMRSEVLAEEDPFVKGKLELAEDSFKRTRIGKMSAFYTLIFQELNYLMAKVSAKRGFYVVRISKTNWFIIAHPTGTHLFYTLLRLNDNEPLSYNDLFDQPVVNNKEVTIFPWRSTDKDRISSMLSIYENMVLVNSDISSHYGYLSEPVPKSKTAFTFLMNCDNKQTTADCLYLWREMLVKLCSGDKYSKPGILFSKMPKIRSLLAVFILRQMRKCGSDMIENPPVRTSLAEDSREDDDVLESADNFDNLLDLVTGMNEMKFENAIYTSYLACYHSYATMSKTAADFKVVEKIVEYELMLRQARGDNMWKTSNYGDVRPHEFNLRLSLIGGMMKRKMLKDIYSESYDTHLYRCLMGAMKKTFLEFGTFKASLERTSRIEFSPLTPKSTVRALETIKEQFFVMEKCISSPYEDLESLFKFVEEPIYSKIDKKMDQAKGLREILTMDMRSRFFLNIIERFMEKLNRDSPSEVLSKGDQKLKIVRTIDEAANELREEGYDLFIVDQIIDHSKWCQLFVMSKFATHLAPILPKEIFRIFCAILNKVTRKRILLNDDFLSKLSRTEKIFSDSLSELRNQFLGRSEYKDLIEEMQISMKNFSNMGQGWLQNLSGSDGDTDMQVTSSLMEVWLQGLKNRGKVPDDTKIFNFRISSSDDQRQRKILKIKKGHEVTASNYLRVVGIMPYVISKHSCKKMSMEKSELFSMNQIGEFNQFFTSGNMNFVGTCKFTRAALEIPITVSISDRFFNFSNTRRNLLENGVDILTASLGQLMQLRVHYRSLGMAVDPLFDKLYLNLTEWKSPYFGWFPWEKTSLLGMFGNEIARYDNICDSTKSRFILSRLLKNLDLKMGAKGELGPTINFRITKKDKFKKFLKKFDLDLDYFSKRPQILYSGPESRDDTYKLIGAKAHLSEAELAFVFESSAKAFSSSFLILREPVIKLSIPEGLSRNNKRCNIFGLISFLSTGYSEVSLESVLPMFQDCSTYEMVRSMSPKFSKASSVRAVDFARRKSTMYFSNISGGMEIPLIDCVRQIWFGIPSGHNSKLTIDSFESYKVTYSWLRDTHEDTKNNGLFNFENPFQLKNTLESLKSSDLRFSIVSPLRQSGLDKMVRNYMKYNFMRMHRLVDSDVPTFKISRDVDMYRVARILSGPFDVDEKIGEISDLDLSGYKPHFDSNLSRRKLYAVWLIERSKCQRVDVRDIVQSLLLCGKDYIPYYKVPQVKNKDGSYSGNMILDLIFESGSAQIEFVSGKLKIVSKSSLFLNSKSKLVYDLLIRMGFGDKMTNQGPRLAEIGVIERSKTMGFVIEMRSTLPTVSDNDGKLSFDYEISDSGRVKIKISSSLRGKQDFDFSFFIADWTIAGQTQEESVGYEAKWISNEPLNLNELKKLIRMKPEWAKVSYRSYMDGIVLPSSMLESRLKTEFTEFIVDPDLVDISKIGKDLDFSCVSEFIEEAGMIEALTEEGLGELDKLNFDLEVTDFDSDEYQYFAYVKTQKLNNNMFKRMNDELLYMGVFDLYRVDYRLPISSSDEWFDCFCFLTDYLSRPLLDSKRALAKPEEEELNDDLRLGVDKVLVEVSGDRFFDALEPARELFKNTMLFQNSSEISSKGIFVVINGKREQLKLKKFGKYEILNQFTDFILDKIGVEKQIIKTTHKRTGEFSFSKEEVELSEKVARHWKRFDRYKDDFVFDSRLGEFFVENPTQKDS